MAPKHQIIKAAASQVALNRAVMGWLLWEAPWPAAGAAVLASEARMTEFPGPPTGARLSVSEIWLPELMPVETDQSGLCQVCGSQASNSKHGRLATARNQTQWRVAAAARGRRRHKLAATASTTTLLSPASNNGAVNAAR
jgi:hypothetical protein